MRTSMLSFTVGRLVAGAVGLLLTSGCGGELLRTGRSPVYLVVYGMSASAGGTGNSAFLLSDVRTVIDDVPTIVNDNVTATIGTEEKNRDAAARPINSITLTRYRVVFLRTDGRNTPGVDVPYGFDGGLGVTLGAGERRDVVLELVRHQAKLEPPLKNLEGVGGLGFISTIAEITFYGRDQNGNEASVTGRIDVQFGDFADR